MTYTVTITAMLPDGFYSSSGSLDAALEELKEAVFDDMQNFESVDRCRTTHWRDRTGVHVIRVIFSGVTEADAEKCRKEIDDGTFDGYAFSLEITKDNE